MRLEYSSIQSYEIRNKNPTPKHVIIKMPKVKQTEKFKSRKRIVHIMFIKKYSQMKQMEIDSQENADGKNANKCSL